jgi:hypothetical protein
MPRDEDDWDDHPRRSRRDREDDDYDRPRGRRRDEGDATGGLIPYKNGLALAAYYCGVFSFIPCVWGTLSVLAIVFGFLGLAQARKHPEAKGQGHAIAGIVCGSVTLLLAVACVVWIIVASAIK